MKEIYLAGGCFWGTEKYFGNINGIKETTVGYANGNSEDPSYEEVCSCNTGHAETVKIKYNPDIVLLSHILDLFYDVIDPTAVNRQGGDVGVQYRTGIYYTEEEDYEVILESIKNLQKSYDKRIEIEVMPLENFYIAEEYHQKYLDKNPYGYCHISSEKFLKAYKANEKYERKTKEQLKKMLTDRQYDVTQNSGTEPPFNNEYFSEFSPGIYVDITTGEPLFVSSNKFESGCGWPSFSKPIDRNNIKENIDRSFGRTRTEVRSKTGNSHLGHVFNDGPTELGGLRYCINSAALKFIPKDEMVAKGYAEYISLVD